MTAGDSRWEAAELTVAVGVARALVDFAEARGTDRGELLQCAGIPADDLLHQDDRLPIERYLALMTEARALCSDPAFALHFGEAVDLSEMSIVGLMDHDVETVADAFAQINRYGNLVMETGCGGTDRLVIEHRAGEVWIIDRRPKPNSSPELTEATLARMACGARRYFGDGSMLKAVHVTHRAPEHRDEYEWVFQATVVFESERNALVYEAAWWEQRISGGSPYVSRILGAHADRLLSDLEQSKSIRGRVERALTERLHGGQTGMEVIAAELGLSRQTLFRRLKAAGVTYTEVLDELRRDLACRFLLDEGLSVKETAYSVGFSEPAPFSRAFKRWTGLSPRAYVARARERINLSNKVTGT